MPDTYWISIPNWKKFQHYRDRRPIWIKVYLELRDKDEWVELSLAERGLLVSIWVEFAARGALSRESLSRTFGKKVSQKTLDRLNRAGFIEYVASNGLAIEKRREEKANLLADLEPDNPEFEPPRDPDALRRIQELSDRINH